ncbi:MAG: cobalamin B12-binding domain-containing protein [Chloroflexota bacterium]|nr:cobalamin B12-binding domain-containing protein [Chloroflexota bacterium]
MKTLVAGAIGECVHVAGVINFLRLAEQSGWRTVFLGPAVSPDALIEAARKEKATLVGVSYRLTPETGERLLGEFAEAADELHQQGVKFVFGGTPPVAERASAIGFFDAVFDGNQPIEDILNYLRGQKPGAVREEDYPQTTIERILWKQPYPILRHHFGQPTMAASLEGIRRIAEAKALDVISLGIDQDAQENFFHPDRQNPRRKGAGGVPVRSAEDYQELYQASRRGNFPLMRTYSGTDDFIRLAEMYCKTINIAWCAIPIFWFNQMDGRGPWPLEESIRKHQEVMAWYGRRDIPVELNEPHHWGIRDAPDVIFVVSAYLSAYNAKAFGVRDYVAQMMFNTPPGTSDAMDLAKMLACLAITEPLQDETFRIWRETRTGLLSYPLGDDAARAHLAASIYLQMAVKPHIVHIVGHTEAHHAATADDVIAASKMARQAIENAIKGQPDMTGDPTIQKRIKRLVQEVQVTLGAIRDLANDSVEDPLIEPEVLGQAVRVGILDAPHLKNNPFALGKIRTRIVEGASQAVNSSGESLSEEERISKLLKEAL